ncbi:MAG: S-layer homology domain-containing protein [bacterium]|nr:S-layer homology domain-containing protein [bacterium]
MIVNYKWTQGLLVLGTALTLSACGGPAAQQTRSSQSKMDTPAYHQQIADRHLLQGDYGTAKSEYNLALELQGNHSKSESGLAVALAYLASGNVTEETKDEVFARGSSLLEKALDHAQDNEDKARAHVNALRFYVVTERPKDGWFDKAQDHFEDAVKLAPSDPEPYYFMGSAHASRLDYEAAIRQYEKVMAIGGRYDVEAGNALKEIQKIQRALPGSRFGEQLANESSITRADTAALLIAELRLDRLYMSRSKEVTPGFMPPSGQRRMELAPSQKMPEATDLYNHPMKNSIEMVLSLGIKGLEADAAHKFHPSEALTRAEFAMVLQDVLVKITQETDLDTRFVGQDSPFDDVNASRWYYNAVRTAVTRNLMEPAGSGKFQPMGKVSGADALLAVRKLKEELKRY